jgi:hypothetical protein
MHGTSMRGLQQKWLSNPNASASGRVASCRHRHRHGSGAVAVAAAAHRRRRSPATSPSCCEPQALLWPSQRRRIVCHSAADAAGDSSSDEGGDAGADAAPEATTADCPPRLVCRVHDVLHAKSAADQSDWWMEVLPPLASTASGGGGKGAQRQGKPQQQRGRQAAVGGGGAAAGGVFGAPGAVVPSGQLRVASAGVLYAAQELGGGRLLLTPQGALRVRREFSGGLTGHNFTKCTLTQRRNRTRQAPCCPRTTQLSALSPAGRTRSPATPQNARGSPPPPPQPPQPDRPTQAVTTRPPAV